MNKHKTGFTLIELLVVVLIIGVLAAIAVPKYQMAVEKSRAAEGLLTLKALSQAASSYCLATGQQASDAKWSDLEVHYPATENASDSVQNFKTIGYFNCYITSREIKCARKDGPYSLSWAWPCSTNRLSSCMPRDGLNGTGAKICRAIFGGGAFACAEQCNQVCNMTGSCQSVCVPDGPCTLSCSSTCTEQCNEYCT